MILCGVVINFVTLIWVRKVASVHCFVLGFNVFDSRLGVDYCVRFSQILFLYGINFRDFGLKHLPDFGVVMWRLSLC